MVGYAYVDIERKFKILPEDAVKGISYFCPNKDCTAHLQLCHGEKLRPYFRAKVKDDIQYCQYHSHALSSYRAQDFDEKGLKSQTAIKNLMQSLSIRRENSMCSKRWIQSDEKKKAISTLKDLYNACMNDSPDTVCGDAPRGKILLYNDSLYMYNSSEDICGLRVVAGSVVESGRFYYRAEKKFKIQVKDSLKGTRYVFEIYWQDNNMYNDNVRKLYNYAMQDDRKIRKIIVVAGDWQANGRNRFNAMIYSDRQIYLPELKHLKGSV